MLREHDEAMVMLHIKAGDIIISRLEDDDSAHLAQTPDADRFILAATEQQLAVDRVPEPVHAFLVAH
jgi:hypothetical protein